MASTLASTAGMIALGISTPPPLLHRHLPLRCHLINLGGCIITYGRDFGCQLFSEPALAVKDADLYLRSPDGARSETLIAGPLLGALRTAGGGTFGRCRRKPARRSAGTGPAGRSEYLRYVTVAKDAATFYNQRQQPE